jgi:hypothetical protein
MAIIADAQVVWTGEKDYEYITFKSKVIHVEDFQTVDDLREIVIDEAPKDAKNVRIEIEFCDWWLACLREKREG